MTIRNSPVRIDLKFKELLKEIPRARIQRGIEKKITKERVSTREMTRLMMNTPSFAKVIEELKSMPRKEDLE